MKGEVGAAVRPALWSPMKLRIPDTYALSIVGGTSVGAVFGDKAFPVVEVALGDPLADIFLALLGAIVAALLYEIVAKMRH
jgi:uncharacterized membrane protein YeaQ/YmgE (transglycosylase-associated protein family)